MSDPAQDPPVAWEGVAAALGALGRAALLTDDAFKVLSATPTLDSLVCAGASVNVRGRPLRDLLGAELLADDGAVCEALRRGDRVEGRRAFLHCHDLGARLVSISIAPLSEAAGHTLQTDARYLVVLRPAEDASRDVDSAVSQLGIVTRSPQMLELVRTIEALHRSEATVLITGESGTGKEVVARAIHMRSRRHEAPFVGVNCAALPGGLLESELFGHVKGAFTGADTDRTGRVELAARGTLFLDEIGDMPAQLQVKLLRVLQERQYERVGESTSRPFTARVVAATNVEIGEALESGQLRTDLYYRLRVVPLHVPPLRERMEDLDLLARALLERIGSEAGRAIVLSPDALRRMRAYSWPGNVRELENVLRFATAMCAGQTLGIEHLPPPLGEERAPAATPIDAPAPAPRDGARGESDEATRIRAALDDNHWRRADAARALGISRTTLWRRMQALGIE